jgi:hypothetical protein
MILGARGSIHQRSDGATSAGMTDGERELLRGWVERGAPTDD